MLNRLLTMASLAALVGALAYAAPALAVHPQATGAVKERQAAMGNVGKALQQGIVPMIQGKVPYDANGIRASVATIEENAKKFVTLFPAGSDGPTTDALPAVWKNPDGFKKAANQLLQATSKLSAEAPGGLEAARAAFKDVGQACGACHTDFRKPKAERYMNKK